MNRRRFLVGLGGLSFVACSTKPDASPTATGTSTTPAVTVSPTATERTPTEAATETPSIEPTPRPPNEPRGFPIDPTTRLGLVVGAVGSRVIEWRAGPEALPYSRDDQPSDDPVRANAGGWNARTHVEYEGQPAVDWYVSIGTPVVATLSGTATLYVNTVSNPFDVYGVSREPYIGDPDRSRAPISPFPGPGGGQGVFIRVSNPEFTCDFGHLEPAATLDLLRPSAFIDGYTAGTTTPALFAPLRDFRTGTAIAAWDVAVGVTLGFTGDSGYSEAPHLHYTVRRTGAGNLLCPTTEPGFEDAGWLFR